MANYRYSVETLVHFQCPVCEKWWAIGDAPLNRDYYCPWCGQRLEFQAGLPAQNAGAKIGVVANAGKRSRRHGKGFSGRHL